MLSLALESNPTDLPLMLFYLKLYGKQKPADRGDYPTVCENALAKQPCYQVFMMVSSFHVAFTIGVL